MGCSASQSVLSRLPAAACFHNLLRFLSSSFLWVSNVEKVIFGLFLLRARVLYPSLVFAPSKQKKKRKREIETKLGVLWGRIVSFVLPAEGFFFRIGSLSAFLFFSFFAIFLFNGLETLVHFFARNFFTWL